MVYCLVLVSLPLLEARPWPPGIEAGTSGAENGEAPRVSSAPTDEEKRDITSSHPWVLMTPVGSLLPLLALGYVVGKTV